MKTFPRRRQQYLFASLLGVIAAVNLLFFFILYTPARTEYFTLQDSIEKARMEIQTRRLRIDRLEKLNGQLETSAQDRHRLFTGHFIPWQAGWSEIVPQLEAMVQKAGVKNTRKDYSKEASAQYGLFSVKIRLLVTGPYANVMSFIQDLETAETFFIINSIDVRGGTPPADISMNLNLETFFFQ
jgi:hypothetical protein